MSPYVAFCSHERKFLRYFRLMLFEEVREERQTEHGLVIATTITKVRAVAQGEPSFVPVPRLGRFSGTS